MRKHMKRMLGYLLAITIFISDIPIVVNAEEDEPSVSQSVESVDETLEVETEETTPEEAEIISELTEKRDETTKYFAMSDGTTKACLYPQNIHYLDEGEYKEIDNTLIVDNENGKTYYKNKKNSFSVKIPENYTDDYIEFSDENGYVKFKLKGATNKKIEKIEKEKIKKNKDKTLVDNVNDKAIFKSIKGNIDIEYDVAGNKLKETIVLYKKTKKVFVFDVKTSAEKALLNKDNSVSFYNEDGSEIYTIQSPYMTDAAGEYSNDIKTTLVGLDDTYTITYKPNYEWLSAKERVYPVKIDPTLFQAIYKETVADTYVTNAQTSSDTRGYWDVMNIGKRNTTTGGNQIVLRGLIKFDIPSEIGSNDCIVDAKLDLVHCNYTDYVSNNGIQIDVHELTQPFSEESAWWGNQPTYDPIITDYAIVNTGNYFSGTSLSYDSYNLTRLVNRWHTGEANYGIILKLHDDTSNVSSRQQVYYFAKQSTYYGTVSKFVEITYRNAVGLEDYWSYTTQSFGQYGTGYVNNYNGNLVYVHDDTSYNSGINGFTISHIYNKNLTKQNYQVNGQAGYFGTGWRLNLVQKLEPVTVTGNSSVKYVYTDGDGTKHYFVQTSDGKIIDEDGLGYTYESISEGELQRKITDKDGTIYKFDYLCYLRKIIDKNGNSITINYAPIPDVDNYPTSIYTSTGGWYVFHYDSNYNLTSITDNAGRSIQYRYSSNNLIEIQYPDGSKLKFSYDSGGLHLLQGITFPDGTKTCYSNYSPSGKVSKIQQIGTDGKLASNVCFIYSQNQTQVADITTSDIKSINYQFDTFGRPTCVYDNQGNAVSQSYTDTNVTTKEIFKNNKVSLASSNTNYVHNLIDNGSFSSDLSGWEISNGNTSSGIVTNEHLYTQKTVKLKMSATGNIKVLQKFSALPTNTYTATAYVKLDNVQSTSKGVAIEVLTGNSRLLYSEYIKGTTDTEIDNGFTKLTFTFTLNSGETLRQLAVGLFSATGTIYVDCVQLEEGATSNAINLLSDSSFEKSTIGSSPSYFFGCKNGSISNNYARTGSKSFRIGGSASDKIISGQAIKFSGKKGNIYNYGAWGKAYAIPSHEGGESCFKIVIQIHNDDGTVQRSIAEFNEYVSDWQFTSTVVVAQKPHYGITVYMGYYNACNTAYFDNIFLYRDVAQSYKYDSNGNIVTTADYANQQANYEYNNSNLTKMLDPTGTSYEYAYDTKKNMVSSKSDEGLQTNITYDSQGNPTRTTTGNNNYATSLQSGKSYYIRLKNTGKYLCIPNNSTNNYTSAQQENFTGQANQRWILEEAPTGGYYLHPEHAPDKSLHITNSANYENASVAQYSHIATPQQTFRIILQSDHAYKLIPDTSPDGKVISVEYSYQQNIVTLMTPQGTNNAGQSWYFEEADTPTTTEIEDGAVYQFRARNSGKYVDVTNSSTSTGTNVTQNLLTFAKNQKFLVKKYESTEYYTLSPTHDTTKLVQISSDTGMDNAPYLQLSDNTINDRKLFKLEYNSQYQGFHIIPKFNETLALGVANSSISSLTNLIFTEKSSAINRFFIAEKTSDTITSSATYQNNGNYLRTTTDARGNTTTYNYDIARGLQTGVIDAKGTTTTYAYNELNDRLETVSSGNSTVSYQYETNGALKKIISPSGSTYNFAYDTIGRTREISVGTQMLSEMTYISSNSSLVGRMNYGNGAYKTYQYDTQDRVTSEATNGTTTRTYIYDKQGNTAQITDHLTNITTNYTYDLIGRISRIKASDGQISNFVYDKYNRLSLSKWSKGDMSLSSSYIYGDNSVSGQKAGLIYGVKLNGTQQVGYEYDELIRLQRRLLYTTTPYATEYAYLEGSSANTTSTLVKSIKNGNDTLTYTYDELGNITSVSKNGAVIEQYTYDALNQLISATYGGNTYTYSYDNGGNITEIKKNDVAIKTYTYGDSEWKDKLTVFNGETISYDEIGNPLTYRSGMTFTWQNGRQLVSVSKEGMAATYTYDADGLRTSKTVNGTITEYYWLNGTLYGQKTGDESIFYLYDESGRAYGFILQNGTEQSHYYYEFNLQGDIIGIIDSTGTKVVEYTYGAWGDILSITGTLADTIGQKNPLRYRGYYYDAETGFYYVSSRYYDPEIGRFINADSLINQSSVIGNNMFAYCLNNPINMADNTGNLPFFVITAAIGAVVGAIAGGVIAAKNGKNVWAGIGIGAAAGALVGAGAGAVAGAVLAGSATASTGMVATGASSLAATISTGGIGAGLASVANNLSQATNKLPTVDPVKNALKQLDSTGLRPGQTEISRAKIMDIVNSFDITKAQSSIYSNGTTRFLVDGHHTTVASVIVGKGSGMNMGIVTNQLPSATNIYWSRKWYEFGKTVIKIME